MTTALEYPASRSTFEQDDFVLRIPAGIRSKVDLIATLASTGRFPNHFGSNWDAVLDCLRDLSWISNRRVVIVHSDVPLKDNPSECLTYLETLRTAFADWLEVARPNAIEPPVDWPYVEHELRVIFPVEVRETIERLVADDA